jgi:hypothetical protein
VLALGSLPLAACGPSSTGGDDDGGGPGDPGIDLAKIAIDNTERAMLGAHGAGSFIADSSTFAESLSSLGGGSTVCSTSCDTDGLCTADCVEDPVTVTDLQEGRQDLQDGISDLIQSLREELFTSETLEASDSRSATYLFAEEELCGESVEVAPPAGGSPAPAPAPTYDPECVDQVSRLQPRVRFTSASPGNVNAAILLTSSRHSVTTFEFHQDHVSVAVDLGEIKATLESVGEDLGNLSELDGTMKLELRRNGNLDYSLLASVLDALVLGVSDEETGDEMRIGLGASDPSTEVRLDGHRHHFGRTRSRYGPGNGHRRGQPGGRGG